MKTRTLHGVLFVLLALPSLAQQTYSLKTKSEPAAGKAFTVSSTFNSDLTMAFSDSSGKLLQTKQQSSSREAFYVETTLAQKEGDGSVFTRDYKSASDTTDGVKKSRSFEGRTITFSKNGGEYSVTPNVGELTAEDTKALLEQANSRFNGIDEDEAVLPKKPVRVGESWDVDLAAMANGANFGEIDLQHSTGKATLTKIYEKDGHQFGQIDSDIVLVVNSASGMTFVEPAKLSMHYSFDGALDGSGTQGTGRMTAALPAKMIVDSPSGKITAEFTMKLASEERHTAETAVAAGKAKR